MQSSRHSFRSLANIEESTLASSSSTSSDTNLHTFIETTYYHPTFCNLCGGLLVGLFKQGLKCKNCRFNVHKNCMKKVANNCGLCDEDNTLDELKMHSFIDKTYFNPTYCNFCGGLLVGLVLFKQGLQCKYCKYDCHKNCLRFVPRHCEANNCTSYDESTKSPKTNSNATSSTNTTKHDVTHTKEAI